MAKEKIVSAAKPIFGVTTVTPSGTYSPSGQRISASQSDFHGVVTPAVPYRGEKPTPPTPKIKVPEDVEKPKRMPLTHRTISPQEIEQRRIEMEEQTRKMSESSTIQKFREAPAKIIEKIPSQRGKALALGFMGSLGEPHISFGAIPAAVVSPKATIAKEKFKMSMGVGAVTAVPETASLPFKAPYMVSHPKETAEAMGKELITPSGLGEMVGGAAVFGGLGKIVSKVRHPKVQVSGYVTKSGAEVKPYFRYAKDKAPKVEVQTLKGIRSSNFKEEFSAAFKGERSPSGGIGGDITEIFGRENIKITTKKPTGFFVKRMPRTRTEKIFRKPEKVVIRPIGGMAGEFGAILKKQKVSYYKAKKSIPREMSIMGKEMEREFLLGVSREQWERTPTHARRIKSELGISKTTFQEFFPIKKPKKTKANKNDKTKGFYCWCLWETMGKGL